MTENNDPASKNPDEEAEVSWQLIGVIVVIFLCFTIIPALIFFSDRR